MMSLEFCVKADSATQFSLKKMIEPSSRKCLFHSRDDAESDLVAFCDVSNRSVLAEFYHGFDRLCSGWFDYYRTIASAPLDEHWYFLSSEDADLREKILDCLRTIAAIHNVKNWRRGERVCGAPDVERYEKAFLLSLRMIHPIRKSEKELYHLNDCSYDIHYVRGKVIIAKTPRRGILGWIDVHSGRGYGVERWRQTIKVATLKLNF